MTLTTFLELAKVCEKLTKTTKTLEKTKIVSNFLSKLEKEEISPAIFLIIGTIFSETDPRTLNINWKSLEPVLKSLKQKTLFQEKLTITSVYKTFLKIAQISGKGSQRKKKDMLISLFSQVSPLEKKFLMRNIFGEMRHGVKEGVMIKAISVASGLDYSNIKRAYMINGNIGEIGKIALEDGEEGIKKVSIKLFQPIKPMLGEIVEDLNQAFNKHGKNLALEYKYDGIRVQIHKSGKIVRIFTRHLKEITSNFPEIIKKILDNIEIDDIIVEGELIAIDSNGRPLPFQDLMHRFKRIYEIKKVQQLIPVSLLLFDIIFCNGKSFLNIPYQKRWKKLSEIVKNFDLAKRIITNNIDEANIFYNNAISEGHEGVMIKALTSIYHPGERKNDWLKLKSEIRLDIVIIAADWGSGRRHKWLSNYHLAVIDEKEEFQVIGKTFKGLTDQEFENITEELLKLKINDNQYTV
ncbi:MAG: ATP-dependent DNA ligase, partial [Candidatus Helarchaeota archaeon]|nr:ATP-dependent DNA ligase [Candidatus Helarchaeota archaeon]